MATYNGWIFTPDEFTDGFSSNMTNDIEYSVKAPSTVVVEFSSAFDYSVMGNRTSHVRTGELDIINSIDDENNCIGVRNPSYILAEKISPCEGLYTRYLNYLPVEVINVFNNTGATRHPAEFDGIIDMEVVFTQETISTNVPRDFPLEINWRKTNLIN